MRIALVAALLFTAACSGKDAASVDSAAASDSSALPMGDNAGANPQVDTMQAYPPADASGNLTGETRKSSGGFGQDPPAGRIDRDSAFGPIGTMDSHGNRDTIRK